MSTPFTLLKGALRKPLDAGIWNMVAEVDVPGDVFRDMKFGETLRVVHALRQEAYREEGESQGGGGQEAKEEGGQEEKEDGGQEEEAVGSPGARRRNCCSICRRGQNGI